MKKITNTIAILATLTLASVNANAQLIAKSNAATKKALEYEDDPAAAASKETMGNYKINLNAVRDFVKDNPSVNNASWEISKKGFVVRFVEKEIKNMHYYDERGKWEYSIQTYGENALPKDIRATVKATYYDFSISSVQEINTSKNNTNPIYIIHLKNNDSFKTIRINDGAMEEVRL